VAFADLGLPNAEQEMLILIALGQDVEITVRPTRKKHGDLPVALG
jgi:hypothetical protein